MIGELRANIKRALSPAVARPFLLGLAIGTAAVSAAVVSYVRRLTDYTTTVERQLLTEQAANGAADFARCDLTFASGISLHAVQVAQTESQKARGLSHRSSAGQGMYFPMPKPDRMAIWMRDTYFPLTVAFLDPKGVIFRMEDMAPNSDTFHFSQSLASGALELSREDIDGHGLRIEDKLTAVRCP
jgi:uncharacterized membrane protein (UPF0127 family)